MVGKFVPGAHANAAWLTIIVNQIDGGDLPLLPTILGVAGNVERSEWRPDNRTITLIEPFGGNADFACRRTASFSSPLEHAHAVGHLGIFR
jgi:hypothetical protein